MDDNLSTEEEKVRERIERSKELLKEAEQILNKPINKTYTKTKSN